MTQTTKAGTVGAVAGQEQGAGRIPPFVHDTAESRGLQIYVGSRIVGEVQGGVFRKVVRSSVHMLRRPPAWALDLQSLLDAEAAGAIEVQIRDAETGATYVAPIASIRRCGFVLDRGHGRQIALTLQYWQVRRGGQPLAEQLALFEV